MNVKKYIQQLRAKRLTYEEIGTLLNISRQRAHQIANDYRSKGAYNAIPPLQHKILSQAKKRALGLPSQSIAATGVQGGRDSVRELVRLRDKHTCQVCQKRWRKGTRRFDVHHLDPERESTRDTKWDREHLDRLVTLCHRCHLNLDSVRKKMRTATIHS